MRMVNTERLSGVSEVFCASDAEVLIHQDRELSAIAEHHSPEAILDHALKLEAEIAALPPEEFAKREARIVDYGGNRADYEFRETASVLWENAPARMVLEIERCKRDATVLGIEFNEPSEITVESVRAAKALIAARELEIEEIAVAETESIEKN